MKPRRLNFNAGLGILGVLLLAVVLGDLIFRGWHRFPAAPTFEIANADENRGRQAIVTRGCGACHVIPGIPGARGRVGPQLRGFRNQTFIAGRLPNNPDNLVRWISDPRAIDPETAMPDLGIEEAEAADIAAYLFSNP